MANKNILIVDDEPNLYTSLAVIFKRSGYTVCVTPDAREAFLYLKTCQFDAILLDLKLNNTDGMQLLSMFKRLHPNVPVVILTGDSSSDRQLEAFRLGARGYLLKPVYPGQILACIGELVKEQPNLKIKPGRVRPVKIRRQVDEDLW